MVAIDIRYEGDLRCAATHGPSGTLLQTDAPKDNHGKGERFSPTDLVATALGSCMMTLMGITARKLNLDLTGMTCHVTKEMSSTPPRRIAKLTVKLTIPMPVAEDHRHKLEEAAHTCPVHHSLHPDINVAVDFKWG